MPAICYFYLIFFVEVGLFSWVILVQKNKVVMNNVAWLLAFLGAPIVIVFGYEFIKFMRPFDGWYIVNYLVFFGSVAMPILVFFRSAKRDKNK